MIELVFTKLMSITPDLPQTITALNDDKLTMEEKDKEKHLYKIQYIHWEYYKRSINPNDTMNELVLAKVMSIVTRVD